MANMNKPTKPAKQAAESMRNAFGKKPEDDEEEEDEEEPSFASKVSSGVSQLMKRGMPARKGY